MVGALTAPVVSGPVPPIAGGCDWWNLICQGGQQVADSGLASITNAMANGLVDLFGQIATVVDQSTRVPLSQPGYRETYYSLAAFAVPVIALIYSIALLTAAIRHDLRAVTRSTVGLAVSAIGAAVYVVFAQLLVTLDDWLAHGIVAVTGADFATEMTTLTGKFEQMGAGGSAAANALMLIMMFVALLAGVVLWVVLLLRKMAILVVVAFAPLLIAGWLWPPTRSWSRKATEALVALVFAKSVIYMIFGIGLSLLMRSNQSLSDFVGVVVLLCGACFAPLMMLRLVHFAADSHLAGDMVATLRGGAAPTVSRLGHAAAAGLPGRQQMASAYASTARTNQATVIGGSAGPSAGAARTAAAGSTSGAAGAGAAAGAAAVPPLAVVAAAGAAKQKSASTKDKAAAAVSASVGSSAGSSSATAPASAASSRQAPPATAARPSATAPGGAPRPPRASSPSAPPMEQ